MAQWRRLAVSRLRGNSARGRPAEIRRQAASSADDGAPSLLLNTAATPDDTEALALRVRAATRTVSGGTTGPLWDSMRTVTPPSDDHRRLRGLPERRAQCRNCWQVSQGWVLVIAVGVCSALSGCFIELAVRKLSSIRYGFCRSRLFAGQRYCPMNDWEPWGDGTKGFVAFVVPGLAMAAASAFLVFRFAPAARGSGIPEVKTILNGFVLPDAVSTRTLCVKVPGLALSVAAGMALGKEGPLVHVAVCWAQLLSGLFPLFRSDSARREIFSAAAAAGVSTAFGAPLGGVLFSLEEVSTYFPSRTLLRSFTAAVSAAAVLELVDMTGTGSLTMFSADVKGTVQPVEFVAFISLGVAGGLIGAAFNAVNIRWSEFRATKAFKRRVHPVMEVTLIAFITLLSSWPLDLLRPLSTEAIHAMFGGCSLESYMTLKVNLGLCTEDGAYAPASHDLLGKLLLAAFVRLLQMTVTFGTKCPAGLFVPSLFIGASLGRAVGVQMRAWSLLGYYFTKAVEPGVYSMVGAGAVLGGVCRVTISLVVIMLELTGGLTYVVPFMISVLVAKMVGDSINEGIYDLYVVLNGYPFLDEEVDVSFTERCCDIMETGITKIDTSLAPRPADLRVMLTEYNFRGYPVLDGFLFIGFVRRHQLQDLLEALEADSARGGSEAVITLDDLRHITDRHVLRMVPDAPLEQAHNVFKQLGCQHIFLVGRSGAIAGEQETLQGILSRKNFIEFLKASKVGHMPAPLDREAPAMSPDNGGASHAPCDNGEGEHAWRFSTAKARRTRTLTRIRDNRARNESAFFGSPSLGEASAGNSPRTSLTPSSAASPPTQRRA